MSKSKRLSKLLSTFAIVGLPIFFNNPPVHAQTCSGVGIVVGTGQTCSSQITNSINGTTITNAGTISTVGSGTDAIQNAANYTISSIANTGTIAGDFSAITLRSGSVITGINNSGNIYGNYANGFYIQGGVISNLVNSGTVYSLSTDGIYFATSTSTIGTLTNTGAIYSGGFPFHGISVANGSITTLNNGQGGNSAGQTTTALDYYGKLPTNYNVIVSSSTHYGQLSASNVSGAINSFGISSLSSGKSAVSTTAYSAVLSGITPTQLGISGVSISGVSNNYSYTLSETGIGTNIWDLIISGYYSGPSLANTQQSLINTAQALQGTYALQNSVLANSFTYDCTVFGANDICVSAGGRNTTVQAANGLNNNSALLIAAYRATKDVRIGAYADQNLSVSNPGGTVNLGNNTPLIGLFAAWNERLDGTGTEVKVSAAYGQKNTTVNRSVVGSGSTASETGSGSSQLNSQGFQVVGKYGFAVIEDTTVSPYVGIRYTQNNMNGYTEGSSSSVTAPLTYSALNTNATTALAGVGASYKGVPQTNLFASAGIESDTNTSAGSYSGTSSSISGLTPVNFNANPVKNRATATLGATYDVEKNQRLGLTGIYRQESYQAVSTTTVMATYTVGF